MIRVSFTSVLALIAIISIAQPIGGAWYFSYQSSYSIGYVKLNHIKDTTIGLENFQVLEKIKIEYAWPGIYDTTYLDNEYLLWKNDSVYRLIDNQAVLLFNFDAAVGDTVVFRKKNPISQSCDSTGMAVVDSIGLQLIQGSNRKWISVTPVFGSTVGLHGKIIEGIGPVDDYFFPEYIDCIVDANEGGVFRCISDSIQVLYSTNAVEYCDFVNSVLDKDTEQYVIYPNPASDIINCVLPENGEYDLFVYDALGSMVYPLTPLRMTTESGVYKINISELPAGIYFIEARGEKVLRGKFVKE